MFVTDIGTARQLVSLVLQAHLPTTRNKHRLPQYYSAVIDSSE